MHKQNWDDLRFVLAVAETGSVNGAARLLGVNHATVLRRVADFEERHGAQIFEKTSRGYRVLADKRDVIAAARDAERAILTVAEKASGANIPLEGKVRITSTDTLGQTVLPQVIAGMQSRSQGMTFELLCTNAHVDLVRLNIDVTVRPSPGLGPDLVGTQVAELGFAVYASTPRPKGWLGMTGPLARSVAADWMADAVEPRDIIGTSDSFMILAELAASGRAQTVLPCFVGDPDLRLVRLRGAMPWMSVPLWVACQTAQAKAPRVRAVLSELSQGLEDRAEQLAGR